MRSRTRPSEMSSAHFEPYHCFLPASPPPLPVRIVFPDGTDDASRDKVLGAVVEVLATGSPSTIRSV